MHFHSEDVTSGHHSGAPAPRSATHKLPSTDFLFPKQRLPQSYGTPCQCLLFLPIIDAKTKGSTSPGCVGGGPEIFPTWPKTKSSSAPTEQFPPRKRLRSGGCIITNSFHWETDAWIQLLTPYFNSDKTWILGEMI